MDNEKHDYTAKFELADGFEFAEQSYHGTLDYALECARAYCVKGETFKLYREGTPGLVWIETKETA